MSHKKKKLLITGGSGLLAINWACAVSNRWDVFLGTHEHHVELANTEALPLDLDNSKRFGLQLAKLSPDLIVHAAGLTSVSECEKDPALALQINAKIARRVADSAADNDTQLIHISTDHLFSGEKSMHTEEEVPQPLNQYARSKLQAEKWVKERCPSALILRTNFFGWGHAYRHSLSDWVLTSLRNNEQISMWDDIFYSPILIDNLAKAAHELAERKISGIVNLGGGERISKYEFGCLIAKHFNLPQGLINRTSAKDNHMDPKRPLDMSLDNSKALLILEGKIDSIEESIIALGEQEKQGRYSRLLKAVKKPKPIPYGSHKLDEADIRAVIEVLENGPITQGKKVEEFGQALADYAGATYGLPVASGTAALHISVAALDIGPDDEVITTPMTFCATSNAVLYQGADVRFVDIDEKTLNMDPSLIEEAITERTKAIMPVDFRGHPAPLAEIKAIADRHGLKVIEDAAHSIGSCYTVGGETYRCGDGLHADLCTFSFHPVKQITTGEGGAIMTNDPDLYQRAVLLGKHGIDRRDEMFNEGERKGSWVYEMENLGFNYRITDFQSALGMSQLKKIEQIKSRRRQIVSYYNEHLEVFDELILPFEEENAESNFHLYVLQIKGNKKFDRYDLFTKLNTLNYQLMVHYIPVHLLSYYKSRYGHKHGDFPVSERFYDRAISLPLYPSMTDDQVEKVVKDISVYIKTF